MLAILYIISIIFSLLTIFFDKKGEFKDCRTCFYIAISMEIVYSLIAIRLFKNNMFNPNLGIVFGFLSLMFSNFAILSDDITNWLNYITCAFLGSVIICFLFSNYYFTNYYVYCNENHNYSECVPIVTTVDGSVDGKSIYGDGFTIGLIIKQNPMCRIYEYHYKRDDGEIVSGKFYESRVTFTYIDPSEAPYVEIYYNIDCAGYRKNTKMHTFSRIYKTCHFYIPENSIANLPRTS